MSDFYQELCNMLIRPTRQIYHLYDLGNPLIGTCGKRQDFQIQTKNNLKVKCSFYQSSTLDNNNKTEAPTIIYLHSLNGSRLEFLSNVEPLLKMGFNISTLDFTGCGLSDGSYVTLGAREKWDVLQLVKYIYKTYKQSNFMIWGRSMGAVAAIKFYTLFQQQRQTCKQLNPIRIMGMVLDSPFSSLNQLAVQIAKNRINIPQIVIKMAFYMIQSSIQTKANFKTSELELQSEVKKIQSPTLIITSKIDTLVSYEHSLIIYNNIPFVDKELMYIESEHNNNREQADLQKIYHFLKDKSKVASPSSTYYTGVIEKKLQRLSQKSNKKHQNLTLSKEKLNRHQSQKNQFIIPQNNNFFLSHVANNNHIKIQEQNLPSAKNHGRQYSLERVNISESKNSYEDRNTAEKKSKNAQVNQNRTYFSAERPKVVFIKEMNQSVTTNNTAQKSKQNKIFDLYSSKLIPVPETTFVQKPFTHSLSYKNIECLKTVKKIKRLEPQTQDNLNEEKQKEEAIKSHMNVITSKLKKKSKHALTKSFLPHQMVENVNQSLPQSQKTLKKQLNAKSSTIIQFSKQTKNIMNGPHQQPLQKQKPVTPMCFSNREILFNEHVPKPFTPQYPLHSSMRINDIQQRRSTSKQHILQKYSMYPINECSRGIKTTLKEKFTTSVPTKPDDFAPKPTTKTQSLIHPIDDPTSQIPRPEFMSCKNMLSSQIISMRNDEGGYMNASVGNNTGSGGISRSKKFLVAHNNTNSKRPFVYEGEETSIFMK